MMARHLIIVERPEAWAALLPDHQLAAPRDYLAGAERYGASALRVINLCRRFSYLSRGYYCSLLAEARGQRVLPAARTVLELNRDILPVLDTGMLTSRLQRQFAGSDTKIIKLRILFGVTDEPGLEDLARRLFEAFPCPVLEAELRRDDGWALHSLRAGDPDRLDAEGRQRLAERLRGYLARPHRSPKRPSTTRYDLAILHDPDEALPPSDSRALARFHEEGRKLGLGVELITRRDLGRIAEFDALFIRTTTRIGHFSFRASKRAESEGLVVIDDPDSILRCTNKLFLAELLRRHRIPAPRTTLVAPEDLLRAADELGYPMVLKVPDGSFSLGVYRADDAAAIARLRDGVFEDAELVLCQEYLYTPFDWRIGTLAGQPLWACRYYMSKHDWRIVNHDGPRVEEGGWDTVAIDQVPTPVLDAAMDASRAVGDGLYGVDVKEIDGRVAVIEVNDNPNIEAGVEDEVLGRELYRVILTEFVRRIEARGRRRR